MVTLQMHASKSPQKLLRIIGNKLKYLQIFYIDLIIRYLRTNTENIIVKLIKFYKKCTHLNEIIVEFSFKSNRRVYSTK